MSLDITPDYCLESFQVMFLAGGAQCWSPCVGEMNLEIQESQSGYSLQSKVPQRKKHTERSLKNRRGDAR